jgi:two-component system chemotaxis response regulator CheY
MMKMQLQKIGVSLIDEAGDGAEAWNKLQAPGAVYDLIISDWNMPVSTGMDLLKRVRSSDRFKTIPFVMVTAEGEKQQVTEALKAGCTDYVVKPFDVLALIERLKTLFVEVK